MLEDVRGWLAEALAAEGCGPAAFELVRTGDALHGDLASNVAFVAAKPAGRAPRDLAQALAERLEARAEVASARVGGAGFVNLRLTEAAVMAALAGTEERLGRLAQEQDGHVLTVMTAQDAGARARWSAEASAAIAEALGASAALAAPEAIEASGRDLGDLGELVGPEGRFGDVTMKERAYLEAEAGRIKAAAISSTALHYFAKSGGHFRRGLFEALEPKLRADALAKLVLPEDLSAEAEELARIICLAQRGDRALALEPADIRAPDKSNPAFALLYAEASVRRGAKAEVAALTEEARRFALALFSYGDQLRLAHAQAEPWRLGAYLYDLALEWLALRDAARRRGEKAPSGALARAASVVFSHGFAILRLTPREEIS